MSRLLASCLTALSLCSADAPRGESAAGSEPSLTDPAGASAVVANVAAAPAASDNRNRGGAMWGADYFPNIELTTHDGRKVRFFDDLIKDKVVAVNFIYTSCADACPMETARMREVQKLLGDRVGTDVFFYSISIDPEHDTPEVLEAYAKTWNVGPGWTFLTGAEEDITALRKKLGVYDADLDTKDHNLSLVVGNQRTGRWMKRSPYENPYMLATQLGSWLHNWKLPSEEERDYADAPAVRNISAGESLFRGRCTSCHTIGGGDRAMVETHQVGPDLYNIVGQRDREWLIRWIREPDVVLAEGDPLANQLLAQYSNIVMPNLRLTRVDAENILDYLEQESRAIDRRLRGEPMDEVPASESDDERLPVAASPLASDSALAHARDVLAEYERLRSRLAADDFSGGKLAARTLTERLAAAPAPLSSEDQRVFANMAELAGGVMSTNELDEARKAFGELSRHVVGLAVADARLRANLHLCRCTMTEGYQKWVQVGETINNPYWGSRMLECGKVLPEWEV